MKKYLVSKANLLYLIGFCCLFCTHLSYGQITYQSLYTPTSFNNASINTALPVGSLKGSADVANGAASYVVPIELPAGTNGVVPSLSIVYSSQANRGNMGTGWGISGLSSITRGLKTIYYDGVAAPVELSSNDKFLLDGMRLVSTQGNYGASGTQYSKETTDFSRTTSYNNIGTGPEWFKHETKEGLILEFGNTADSRFMNLSNTEVMYWALSKMVWPDGNYIEYKYEAVGREHRIKEINYTGNASVGLMPYSKINFVYAQSAFTRKTFEAGQDVSSSHLLERIVITAETGIAFKSYIFKYGHDDINEFLVEIIEEGSDGSQLNSTKLEYGQYANTVMDNGPGVGLTTLTDVFTGDFDGDGFTDMAVANKQEVQDDYVYYTNMFVYRMDPVSNTFDYRFSQNLGIFGTLAHSGSIFNFFSSDYTGDGGDDLIYAIASSDDHNIFMDEVRIYDMNSGVSSATLTTIPKPSATYDQAEFDHKYFSNGDYNGDGIADMILILTNSPGSQTDYKAYIYYGGISTVFDEFTLSNTPAYHPIDNWGSKDVRTLDFDGDGKSELMITKGNYSEIFTFDGLTAKSIHAAGYPTEYHLMFFGDFNGDRKTDMLTRAGLNYGPWSIAYSTGKDWAEESFSWQIAGAEPDIDQYYQGDIVHIADLNGDGRQDIFKGRTYYNSSYHIYYSKGNSFHFTYAPWIDGEDAYVVGGGDFNGDGRSDFAYRGNPMASALTKVFHPFGKDQLLTRVKNGYGHITKWDYRLLTEPTNTYMRTQGTSHPLYTVQVPQYVVYNFTKENLLPTRYEYRDMKLHKGGRGALGFRLITKYAPATSLYEDQEFEINTVNYLIMPKLVRHRHNTDVLQTKTFTNEVTQLNTGSYERILYHRVSNTVDNNTMEGRLTTQSNTVDSYGNIKTSLTDINGLQSVMQAMDYETHGSFIPNKVSLLTTTSHRYGQPDYTETTKYEYNSLGQQTGMYSFYTQAKSVYTSYTYNALGNQDGTTITAAGIEPRTSTSYYDSKGRFVILSVNTLGQSSSVGEYDLRWAKPKITHGIDGLTTSYMYDAYGRVTHTTLPQGYTVETQYQWDVFFPKVYKVNQNHPGEPDTRTWYDRSQRPIETLTYGLNGENIYTKTTYDNHGRTYTTTSPYKTGETPLTTTYLYDNFSRPTSVSNALTTTEMTYSYSGGNLTTTTTKVTPLTGNQVSSTVTDATGKMTYSTDYGGTLAYTYYSHGQPNATLMGSSTLVQHTYDIYGRKTSTEDINAGTIHYETDPLGQLVSETNQLGQTTTIAYDKLGRITTRIGPEGTTTHEYFGSGTGASINQLKKITSFGGDTEDHTYDSYGRLSIHTHTIDGTPYATSYGYNIYNQITSVSQPNGFDLTYVRMPNGYLHQITLQGTPLYTANAANAYLQSTQYTLGSGYQVNKAYHHSIPTSFSLGSSPPFNMTYIWDYPSGNLTSRTRHNITESFGYDHLNRLTTASHPNQTITVGYAANGNITNKTDAGPDYTYDYQRIHAMRSITTPVYPNNINLTAQNIVYTPYLQPAYITEGDLRLDYVYGSDYQRIKSSLKLNGVVQETITYMGDHERKVKGGNTYDIYYIHAGSELVAMAVKTNGGAAAIYYTYTDYLGSIVQITNSSGVVVSGTEQNYDAWGRRRTVAGAYSGLIAPPDWLIRGYTGHEQLWDFRLINMNGRIYDPVLARMHSPDNVVSTPGSSQAYNRYSYVHNNPLKYTDPDGNVPILIPILVGAAVGALTNGINNAVHHRNFFDGVGRAAAFGAISGLVSAGIGSVAEMVRGVGTALDAAVVQINLHGIAGGLISYAQGGNPISGFVSGATSSLVGSFTTHLGGGATATIFGGGLTGGIGAAITGGNFWQGMQQGLITTGLNHVLHPLTEYENGGPGDPPIYDKFDRSQQAILSMTPTERWESFKIFAEATTFALGGEIFSGIKLLTVGLRSRFGVGVGRVFWSGGNLAKNAAMDFAKLNGMKTLEMTFSGRIMNSLSPYLPRSISGPIWNKLSRDFALGATGKINVFQNSLGVSLNSTWRMVEYPILRNSNIFFHIVK